MIKTKTITVRKLKGRRNLGRRDNHTYAWSHASAVEAEHRMQARDVNGLRCRPTVVHQHRSGEPCDGHDHWLLKQAKREGLRG